MLDCISASDSAILLMALVRAAEAGGDTEREGGLGAPMARVAEGAGTEGAPV